MHWKNYFVKNSWVWAETPYWAQISLNFGFNLCKNTSAYSQINTVTVENYRRLKIHISSNLCKQRKYLNVVLKMCKIEISDYVHLLIFLRHIFFTLILLLWSRVYNDQIISTSWSRKSCKKFITSPEFPSKKPHSQRSSL